MPDTPRPLLFQVWCMKHKIDLWAEEYLRRNTSRRGFVYELQDVMCAGGCREHWEIREVKTG